MNIFKKTFNYFRPSFEGEDGKFSYKRASTFIFIIMMIRLALFKIQNEWEFYTFIAFAILYALQTSIITVSQLLIFFGKIKGKDVNNGTGDKIQNV